MVATMLAGAVSGPWLALNVSPLSALTLAAGLLAWAAIGAVIAASRPGDWRLAGPLPSGR